MNAVPPPTPSAPPVLGKAITQYIDGGQRSVDGWLSNLDARLIALLAAHQKQRGITGSVGEIGIHHGRLLILLALTLEKDERAFAVDIFGEQELNLDRSGEGDEARFRANLQRFGVPEAQVAVVRASSLDVRWPELERRVQARARLFSIDGGHTALVTANDFVIADEGLADQGVAILDDYFNPEFPEVSQGVCRHLLVDGGKLVPFAIGDNKILFARPGAGDAYRRMLQEAVPGKYFVRTTEMFGQTVAVFRTRRRLMHVVRQSDMARRLRDHPLGRMLKPVVRRLIRD